MLYKAITLFLLTTTVLSAQTLQFENLKEADAHRQKTLQKLHVAQAPLHLKQDKASAEEVSSYATAVVEAVAFQKWVASNRRCAVTLRSTGNASNDPLNRRRFSKFIWEIHDAVIKTTPPFTRSDIGVAVKMMNDVREVFMLPVIVDGFDSMPSRQ
jgi:hypothetical protein